MDATVANESEAVTCYHCSESAQSSGGFLCFCGVPVTCDLCDGAGCRCCGRWGWFSVLEAAETQAEDADELNALGGYDSAGRGYDAADCAACAGTNLGEG